MKTKEITTIKLSSETKERLDKLKEYSRESYDETLRKMLGILNLAKSEPEKAKGILHKIFESRERNLGIPKEKEKLEPVKKISQKPLAKLQSRFLVQKQNPQQAKETR